VSRQTARYLALLALAVVLFYWKTLLTNQFTLIVGEEGVDQTYAWLHFWVHSIWQGHLPLWDPYAFAGSPFAGEALPTAFYPLRLLFALVPLNRNGMISPRFFDEYLALTHLLCAYLTFALLRELGRSHFAAFTGACAFSLGGLLVRMVWPQYMESCIWLPAVFFFLVRALRAERRDRALVAAALCGLCLGLSILTGGMAFFIMQVIFAVTAVLFYGASSPVTTSSRSHWIRMTLIVAVALVVAGGLGAVQLLPAMEYSKLSLRFIDGGPFPAADKIPYNRLVPAMWPQSIVSGLFPTGFDGKIGGEEYYPFYIGVFPFFLAVTAIWRCWDNVWVKYLTGLSVLTFAYSLGALSPLHGVLYAIVPFLWLTRAADRFLYLVTFALAVLAAFGLDELLDPALRGALWKPANRILKWIALAAASALFLSGIFSQLNLSIWTAFSLVLILGSCGWFYYLTGKPATPGIRVLLAVFILFDLGAFSWEEANVTGSSKGGEQLDQMVSFRGAAEFIKARPGLNRVHVALAPEPNIGDVYQIQSVWGGGAALITAWSQMRLHEDLLNVRYYIKPASTPDPGPVYHDAQWKVYENPHAYPRGWIVHQVAVAPSHDAVFPRLDEPGVDLHRTALLETPLPQPLGPAEADESVVFRSYEPDRMAMDVNAASAGLLVLSEVYYPGWVAAVNGKAAKIYQVDGALRGIAVPAGANSIELRYEPFSFRAGAALSLLTLVCVAAGWVYVRRRASVSEL